MDRTPVSQLPAGESSFIAAIGYDDEGDVLEVEMKNGNVYEYPGLGDLAIAFALSDDLGKFYNAFIKLKRDRIHGPARRRPHRIRKPS